MPLLHHMYETVPQGTNYSTGETDSSLFTVFKQHFSSLDTSIIAPSSEVDLWIFFFLYGLFSYESLKLLLWVPFSLFYLWSVSQRFGHRTTPTLRLLLRCIFLHIRAVVLNQGSKAHLGSWQTSRWLLRIKKKKQTHLTLYQLHIYSLTASFSCKTNNKCIFFYILYTRFLKKKKKSYM